VLVTTPALWFGAFVLASPVLIAILIAWFRLTRRYPNFEPDHWFAWLGRLLIAIVIAVVAHASLSVFAGITGDDRSFTYIQYRFVTDREVFGLLLVAAIAWFVIPRIWIRKLNE